MVENDNPAAPRTCTMAMMRLFARCQPSRVSSVALSDTKMHSQKGFNVSSSPCLPPPLTASSPGLRSSVVPVGNEAAQCVAGMLPSSIDRDRSVKWPQRVHIARLSTSSEPKPGKEEPTERHPAADDNTDSQEPSADSGLWTRWTSNSFGGDHARWSGPWFGEWTLRCTVFAVTGSSAVRFVRPTLDMILGDATRDAWYYPVLVIGATTPLCKETFSSLNG